MITPKTTTATEQVEEEGDFDDEREAGRHHQARHRDPVLEREEPDRLGDDVGAQDDEHEGHQDDRGRDGERGGGQGDRVHVEGADGKEPERRNADGDQDHAGHSEDRAAGQVDVGVSEQPEHQTRDQHDLQHEGQDGQHVELVDVAGGRDDHGKDRHDQGLERVEPDLGAQQRGPQHGELGQQDERRPRRRRRRHRSKGQCAISHLLRRRRARRARPARRRRR